MIVKQEHKASLGGRDPYIGHHFLRIPGGGVGGWGGGGAGKRGLATKQKLESKELRQRDSQRKQLLKRESSQIWTLGRTLIKKKKKRSFKTGVANYGHFFKISSKVGWGGRKNRRGVWGV